MQVLIVLSGGIVRLTGSGLGCTTAPQCVPGSIIPVADQHQGLATVIEFSNRILSVGVGIVALLAVIAAWRSGSKRLLQLSGIPLVFTRSEEHTSELQSRGHLVCRLLLEIKK